MFSDEWICERMYGRFGIFFCFFHNGLMNVHQICHLPSKLGDSKINFFSTHSKHQININKTYGRFKRKTSSYVQYLTCCWNVLVDLGPVIRSPYFYKKYYFKIYSIVKWSWFYYYYKKITSIVLGHSLSFPNQEKPTQQV